MPSEYPLKQQTSDKWKNISTTVMWHVHCYKDLLIKSMSSKSEHTKLISSDAGNMTFSVLDFNSNPAKS
jgi:hypothetical protein